MNLLHVSLYSEGKTLEEANNINKSLMVLGEYFVLLIFLPEFPNIAKIKISEMGYILRKRAC